MQQPILMIEDDQRLAGMVASYLGQNGFEVHHAGTASEGLAMLQLGAQPDASTKEPSGATARPFVLVLLDLMLPDADGLDVCRRIRARAPPLHATPIVMLTAKGDPFDRVVGLELGADDYVAKPFEPRELLARLRAVLRRPPMGIGEVGQENANADDLSAAHAVQANGPLRFGRLDINRDARTVRVDEQDRALTAYQFDLLVALAERAGRVLSREQLIDAVKGETLEPFDRSIDVHMGRLRAAIEDDPKQPRRIITVRGAGYVFAKVQDA
jgi:DNA-binding response OmpR family regulator